jgi:DinB superfamily
MRHELGPALQETVDRETAHLRRITEEKAGIKPSSRAWSQKEELGHLIDSATNNHVRFVQASLQPEYRGPGYQQDGWVALHGYNEMPWAEIVDLWQRYNHLLAALVGRIPEDALQTPCVIGNSSAVTLRFLIEDYLLHMQHHLDHVLQRVQREQITQYPPIAPEAVR